ncbi:MAG TPA: PLDc N-terminal domain-containing protein [Desulfobacterales bacterium]
MTLIQIAVFLALCIPFFLLTVWAVVDVAQRSFDSPAKKVVWWVVASIPFVGFVPYFLIGIRQGRKKTEKEE